MHVRHKVNGIGAHAGKSSFEAGTEEVVTNRDERANGEVKVEGN